MMLHHYSAMVNVTIVIFQFPHDILPFIAFSSPINATELLRLYISNTEHHKIKVCMEHIW